MSASIITSIVTGGTNSHATTSEEANGVATDFVSQGMVGSISNTNGASPSSGSFAVNQDATPDMGVTISGTGNTTSTNSVAYVQGVPTSQGIQMLRARMTADYTSYAINSNSSGTTKYDYIYLQMSPTNGANPSSAADNVITLYTSRSSSNVSDNGTPPTYGVLLAVVTVANGAVSITNANIADKRSQSALSNGGTTAATGWLPFNYALTYGSNNGNKEFTVTTPNNVTGVLSSGMKFSITRGSTPPTQSMAFSAASSQYATKASPTGINFTSAFTIETWLYVNSYQNTQMVVARTDTTAANGFYMQISPYGQVYGAYVSGGAATSFQSLKRVELQRWTHVAVSVTSTSGKTGAVYINGESIPYINTSTAATTITQTGNLTVGRFDAPSQYFDGYISELRVWSVGQSQSSIQTNMAISLTGSETNLVALFQGNGNFNDKTSNANNLTATNGAIATQASNPYNATEYFEVVAASYSNPTSTVTLRAGETSSLPNMTLNSPQYSTSVSPYGYVGPSDLVANVVLPSSTASTTATSDTPVVGLSTTFTAPQGKRVSLFIKIGNASNSAAAVAYISVWRGSVGSGTVVAKAQLYMPTSGTGNTVSTVGTDYPPAGSVTYNAAVFTNTGTLAYGAASGFHNVLTARIEPS